jgi:hypothetical protein
MLTLVIQGPYMLESSRKQCKIVWIKRGKAIQETWSDTILSFSEPPNLKVESVIASSQYTGMAHPR